MTFNQAILASRLGIKVRKIFWLPNSWITNIQEDSNPAFFTALQMNGTDYKIEKSLLSDGNDWEIYNDQESTTPDA